MVLINSPRPQFGGQGMGMKDSNNRSSNLDFLHQSQNSYTNGPSMAGLSGQGQSQGQGSDQYGPSYLGQHHEAQIGHGHGERPLPPGFSRNSQNFNNFGSNRMISEEMQQHQLNLSKRQENSRYQQYPPPSQISSSPNLKTPEPASYDLQRKWSSVPNFTSAPTSTIGNSTIGNSTIGPSSMSLSANSHTGQVSGHSAMLSADYVRESMKPKYGPNREQMKDQLVAKFSTGSVTCLPGQFKKGQESGDTTAGFGLGFGRGSGSGRDGTVGPLSPYGNFSEEYGSTLRMGNIGSGIRDNRGNPLPNRGENSQYDSGKIRNTSISNLGTSSSVIGLGLNRKTSSWTSMGTPGHVENLDAVRAKKEVYRRDLEIQIQQAKERRIEERRKQIDVTYHPLGPDYAPVKKGEVDQSFRSQRKQLSHFSPGGHFEDGLSGGGAENRQSSNPMSSSVNSSISPRPSPRLDNFQNSGRKPPFLQQLQQQQQQQQQQMTPRPQQHQQQQQQPPTMPYPMTNMPSQGQGQFWPGQQGYQQGQGPYQGHGQGQGQNQMPYLTNNSPRGPQNPQYPQNGPPQWTPQGPPQYPQQYPPQQYYPQQQQQLQQPYYQQQPQDFQQQQQMYQQQPNLYNRGIGEGTMDGSGTNSWDRQPPVPVQNQMQSQNQNQMQNQMQMQMSQLKGGPSLDEQSQNLDEIDFEKLKSEVPKPGIWQTSDELPSEELKTAIYKDELKKQIMENRIKKSYQEVREKEEELKLERSFHDETGRFHKEHDEQEKKQILLQGERLLRREENYKRHTEITLAAEEEKKQKRPPPNVNLKQNELGDGDQAIKNYDNEDFGNEDNGQVVLNDSFSRESVLKPKVIRNNQRPSMPVQNSPRPGPSGDTFKELEASPRHQGSQQSNRKILELQSRLEKELGQEPTLTVVNYSLNNNLDNSEEKDRKIKSDLSHLAQIRGQIHLETQRMEKKRLNKMKNHKLQLFPQDLSLDFSPADLEDNNNTADIVRVQDIKDEEIEGEEEEQYSCDFEEEMDEDCEIPELVQVEDILRK